MKQKLLILLCALTATVSALAYDFCVGNICYNIDGENAVVFRIDDIDYSGPVNIPESVTYDGKTYSVTSIDDNAFYGSRITSVVIPNSVISIGEAAFYYCHFLKDVTIGTSVTYIGRLAFTNCGIYDDTKNWENNLLYISNCLIAVGENFYGDLEIKENTRVIAGQLAFNYCLHFGSVTIPNSVVSICDLAFDGCTMTSVTIGESVTYIGDYAFRNNNLNSVTLPSSVTHIGNFAFYGNELTSVTIPESVTFIGESAFSCCENLRAFYGKFASADQRCLICNNKLVSFAPADLTSYEIPNSVTTICMYVFDHCGKLTSVTIPESVTTIGNCAFYYCSKLTSVTIPESVTFIGEYAFTYTGIYNDESNWENGVLYISNCLISTSESLAGDYDIKENTRVIGGYAFRNCEQLTSITIPESVISINYSAFDNCI